MPARIEQVLTRLLESLPGFAYRCLKDEHWTMLYLSPSTRELLGYPSDVLLSGQVTYEQLIHPGDRQAVRAAVEGAVAHGEPFQMAYRVITLSGQPRWFWERGAQVGVRDGVPLLEGYILDISNHQLSGAMPDRKLEALALMAGGIAHDANNLLTVATATLQLAMEEELPDEVAEDLREVDATLDHLATLMSRLLTLSRGESLSRTLTPVDTQLRQFEGTLRHVLGAHHELELELGAEGAHVMLPTGQLEVMVLNLALNAVEAAPDGGTIRLETRAEGDHLVLTVEDDGPGIPRELHEKIFEPLFTTKDDGHGFGLANAHAMVKASGGEISLDSTPGRGARFDIKLPTHQHRQPPPHSSLRVGLIEPNHIVRQLAADTLRIQGHEVFEYEHQRQALQQLTDAPNSLDVLIVSLLTPNTLNDELREVIASLDLPHFNLAEGLEHVPWTQRLHDA